MNTGVSPVYTFIVGGTLWESQLLACTTTSMELKSCNLKYGQLSYQIRMSIVYTECYEIQETRAIIQSRKKRMVAQMVGMEMQEG